ncbi:MAG: ABC transporter permease [Planctomycetota bacterium]|jgi:ABC-2 type transport system permease protein
MNPKRILAMLAGELRMGRRSPIFIGVVLLPLITTVLAALDPPGQLRPRLGIVDRGESEVASALGANDRVQLAPVGGADELRERVASHDLDGGLVLIDGFDAMIRAGDRPVLEFYVCGESLPSEHVLLAAAAIDAVRRVQGGEAPVEVDLRRVGDGRVMPGRHLRILFITTMVLMMSGLFLPALSLAEELVHGTLKAVLVTPARVSEVLASKALLGLIVAIPTSYLTLILNSALPQEPGAVLVTLAVAALISVELGLIFGTLARDTQDVFAFMEALLLLFVGTMLLCMGSSWAQLIAMFIPTYWFLLPLYLIAMEGASLAEVWPHLQTALGLAAAMGVLLVFLGRRMRARLGTG